MYEEILPEEVEDNKRFNIFKIIFYYIIIGFVGWSFFSFIFTFFWFDIKEINIEGNYYTSNETIIKQGRLDKHINLFLFDVEASGLDILKNPWIADVYIKKRPPNRLSVKIIERKPEVLLYNNEVFYLISEEGVILSASGQSDNEHGLYIVTGLDIKNNIPGKKIDIEKYNYIKRIIYALNNIFPEQFYKIQVISNEEYLLFHKKAQIKVRIKDGDQLIDEWYLLERAIQNVIQENTPIKEINMKYEDRLSIILEE
ncbi:MAG: FtsQ-type POTRA domain-containing protein [Candidatus Caldatribacteriota bacterium]